MTDLASNLRDSKHVSEMLPRTWELKPLKRVVTFLEGPGIMAADFEDDGVPLLRIAGLSSRIASLDGCNFLSPILVEQKWPHFRVRNGELLISGSASTGLCAEVDDATVGAIPYTGIMIIRPIDGKADRGFMRWFFLSDLFAFQVAQAQTGSALKHFGPTHLSQMAVVVPPVDQQHAISDFLDAETARIDELIAAKETLLVILAEKRRALVSRAVTCGLDPNTEMRDSGIQWLGEIPAHWKVVPFRFLVDMASGATPSTGEPLYWDGDIPWVSPKDMKRIEIADAQDHVTQLALSSTTLHLIRPPVVLIVVRGMILAHTFPVAITTAPITINQDMKALSPRRGLHSLYLRDFLRGIDTHILSIVGEFAHGTRKLETELLGRVEMCVPPIEEQEEIVAYINREHRQIDEMTSAVERSLILLRERRQALIAAAVTGQLDVGVA